VGKGLKLGYSYYVHKLEAAVLVAKPYSGPDLAQALAAAVSQPRLYAAH
jgi:hypothetical protein